MITTALIASTGLAWCGVMLAISSLDAKRTSRQSAAQEIWRVATLRNGVTAESPFSSAASSINTPGFVEVHPTRTHSLTSAPTHPAALSTAPVPAACPLESPEDRGGKGERKQKESVKVSEKKETPFRFGYPKGGFVAGVEDAEALAAVQKLISDGERRKTALSWAVFGSSSGKVYLNVKELIEKELSTNAD